jgi:hypothetical protein
MVDAARRVAVEEGTDRAVRAQWMEKLDPRIGQVYENDGHTVVGFVLWRTDMGAQRFAILRHSRG